jgi:hypothetical protein
MLPFLVAHVKRKPGDSSWHTVYKNPTHTDLHLNARSIIITHRKSVPFSQHSADGPSPHVTQNV